MNQKREHEQVRKGYNVYFLSIYTISATFKYLNGNTNTSTNELFR